MTDNPQTPAQARYYVQTQDGGRLPFRPDDPTGEVLATETHAVVGHADGRGAQILGSVCEQRALGRRSTSRPSGKPTTARSTRT
jgi:hypothetical protein